MCEVTMTPDHSINLKTMLFEFSKPHNTPTFTITTPSGVVTVIIPATGSPPLAMRVSGDTLELGKGEFGECTTETMEIGVIGPMGTFRVLPNAGGIGISDLRNGKVTISAFELYGNMVLLSHKIAAGNLYLMATYLPTSSRGTTVAGSFDQQK